jgi:hypothetical protein
LLMETLKKVAEDRKEHPLKEGEVSTVILWMAESQHHSHSHHHVFVTFDRSNTLTIIMLPRTRCSTLFAKCWSIVFQMRFRSNSFTCGWVFVETVAVLNPMAVPTTRTTIRQLQNSQKRSLANLTIEHFSCFGTWDGWTVSILCSGVVQTYM